MHNELEAAVKKLRDDFGSPSVMVGMVKDGETFFCGDGFSDVERGIVATPDTIYAIASSSKAFVSTSLCILADQGKIKLDDPVRKHLPDFEMFDAYMTEHLTVKDALSHRSGLPRHDLVWLGRNGMSIKELAYCLKYLPPAFEPRTQMYYQNIMFTLGCVLVESVSGVTWGEFVKKHILDPLGMDHTFTDARDYRGKGSRDESQPYVLKTAKGRGIPGVHEGTVERIDFELVNMVGGAGCISSSVRDMVKWVKLQLGKGELDGVRVFSEDMAKQLHSPQTIIRAGDLYPFGFDEIEFENYGLGWFIESYRGHKFVHHGGTIHGYKSQVGFLSKDNAGFVILTNLGSNQIPNSLGYMICDMVLGNEAADWGARYIRELGKMSADAEKAAAEAEEEIRSGRVSARPLVDYSGFYSHPAYGALELTDAGTSLKAEFMGETVEFLPKGLDNFYMSLKSEGMYIPARFDGDFSGAVTGLNIRLEGLCDMIPFKKEGGK